MNQDYTVELIIKVLGIIEKGIEENCAGSEIKRRIIDEIGYNYNLNYSQVSGHDY